MRSRVDRTPDAARRRALASLHHDGSVRYVVPVGGDDPDRPRIGRRGAAAGPRRARRADRPRSPAHDARRRAGASTELREVDSRAGLSLVGGHAPRWRCRRPATASWSSAATGHLLARPDRASTGAGRPTATTSGSSPAFDPPAWLADRVFYQVFPDRFANGDPATTSPTARGPTAASRRAGVRGASRRARAPAGRSSSSAATWRASRRGSTTSSTSASTRSTSTRSSTTRSNHGYDTIDYDHVAAHFGGDAALVVAATGDASSATSGSMLDIAPNHTGAEHPWFLAAQADPAAPTAGYFIFRARPDDYESWLGVRSLPKLDYREPALRDAMYAGPDAILRRWLRPALSPSTAGGSTSRTCSAGSGPDQLGPDVARGMREAVKEENPDAYLIGEHFYDATEQLAGDQWDGVMNYAGFTTPVLDWLGGDRALRRRRRDGPARRGRRRPTTSSRRWTPTAPRCRGRSPAASTTCSAATTRRASGPPSAGIPAACAPRSGCCSPTSACRRSCTATRSGSRARRRATRRTMPWDEADWDLDLLASCARSSGSGSARAALPGRRVPGPRGRRRQPGVPARHGRGAGRRRRRRGPGAGRRGPRRRATARSRWDGVRRRALDGGERRRPRPAGLRPRRRHGRRRGGLDDGA